MSNAGLSFVVLLAALLAWPSPAAAQLKPIEAFFGSYVGRTISEETQGIDVRDLAVEIRPTRKGFNLSWTTVIHKNDGEVRRQSYAIDFTTTRRPGVFASEMRTNMFGQAEPLDPLKGEPFVWARLEGSTLTVHAMMITDSGGWEMQTYERTLVPEGLNLTFSRVRDGKPLRQITGTLARQ